MARQKVYKKEQILKSAYEIFEKEGFSGLTARNVAKTMNISTQPIYHEFKNMEDLKRCLLCMIFDSLNKLIEETKITGDIISDTCLHFIEFFNKKQPLYLAIYSEKHGFGKEIYELSLEYFTQALRKDQQYSTISELTIKSLHDRLLVNVLGMASLSISNMIELSQEQIVLTAKKTVDSVLNKVS